MKQIFFVLIVVFSLVFIGCESTGVENTPPEITNLTASSYIIASNDTINITCVAFDPDGDSLNYVWEINAGLIVGYSSEVDWIAPEEDGFYQITCRVTDGQGGEDSETIEIEVETFRLLIEPSEQTINLNSEAIFSVKIENVNNLFAISCELVFDSLLVSLPSNHVTIGDFWEDTETILTSENENGRLCIAIGLIQTELEDGIDGDGILFNFSLIGGQIGESDIVFENIYIIDENGLVVDGFEDIEISSAHLIIQ